MITLQALDYKGEVAVVRDNTKVKAIIIQNILYKLRSIVDGNDVDFRNALHNQFSNYDKVSLKSKLFNRLLRNVTNSFSI